MDVEVAHQNIAGNCSPGFAANPGSSTLEREATGAQDARTGASSAVVAERVGSTKTLFSMCNSSIKRRSGRWRLSGYGFADLAKPETPLRLEGTVAETGMLRQLRKACPGAG